MKKDNTIFLAHILDSIEAIEQFVVDIDSLKDFSVSRKTLDAVLRNFTIIGEAVRNLDNEYMENHPVVEWDKIIAMRNIIVHEYFGIDMGLVWDTIKEDLPTLKKQIEKLLAETSSL